MKTQRAMMIGAFYLFVALLFVRAWAIGAQTLADLGLAICAAAAVTLACIADSKIVARPIPHAARWVMLFLWPVAVPLYLLWSRGWRGLIVLVAFFIGYIALALAIPLVMFNVLGFDPP